MDMIVGEDREDDEATETKLLFDVRVLALAAGKERSMKEWANIFYASGFTRYNITPLGLRSVIEVYP